MSELPMFTLGSGDLSQPMVQPNPDDGLRLPWQVSRYDLEWRTPHSLAVTAHLTRFGEFDGRPKGRPWHVFCAGPGFERLDQWCETAADGMRAVARHIEAHQDIRLIGDGSDQ